MFMSGGGGHCLTHPTEWATTTELREQALRTVQHLPLVNAVITETLRMRRRRYHLLSAKRPSLSAAAAASALTASLWQASACRYRHTFCSAQQKYFQRRTSGGQSNGSILMTVATKLTTIA
jgi:hypothetical protein